MTEDDFYEVLAAEVSEAEEMLAEHRRTWHGVPDVYLLMDDVRSLAMRWFDEGTAEPLRRLFSLVKRGLTQGDELLVDAVRSGFVGYTPPWDPALASYVATWPPALRAEADSQTAEWT